MQPLAVAVSSIAVLGGFAVDGFVVDSFVVVKFAVGGFAAVAFAVAAFAVDVFAFPFDAHLKQICQVFNCSHCFIFITPRHFLMVGDVGRKLHIII